jgi:hypothetical protein
MSSRTLDRHLGDAGDPCLQRLSKRLLARWSFESLIVVSTGAGVGMFIKALHRALGHAVITTTGLEKRLVIPAAVLDSVGPFIRQIHGAKGAAGAAPSP